MGLGNKLTKPKLMKQILKGILVVIAFITGTGTAIAGVKSSDLTFSAQGWYG